MKIKRVTTESFFISAQKEISFERELEKKSTGACGKVLSVFVKGKSAGEIKKAYTLLGKFSLSRLEKVVKGVLREKEFASLKNYVYIDLNTLDLFYFNKKKKKIERYDIIQKATNLTEPSARALGSLLRYGEILEEKLDKSATLELANAGLIKLFRPHLKEISATLIDELSPEAAHHTLVKDRVKINFSLPKFDDSGYNLTDFLDTTDTKIKEYKSEHVTNSLTKISDTLSFLFQTENSLNSIIFLPFIECKYPGKRKETRTIDRKFPVCLINEKTQKREGGEKIVPLSLSTELDAPDGIPVEHPTINFSDVIDLNEVKEEIRDEIIYPILKPELAEKFGRRAGGAVLLYGPPGCGKTHVARATIGECFASFFNVNLSDLVSRGADSAPKMLHDIFENATKEAPSVIFMDEIDAIGGTRTVEEEHAARMLLDQLLMEMDGVESLHECVLFIAATNAPWAIDPALRRTERFTKQIFVPPPDTATRIKLFKLYTNKEKVERAVNFDELAKLTLDYSSSDIKAICDDSSKIPWQEAVHGKPERKITRDDFLSTIQNQKSSLIPWFKVARREIELSGEISLFKEFSNYILKYSGGVDESKIPETTFADVGGLTKVKKELKTNIIYPIKNPKLTKKFTGESAGAVLLYGPPGCGKTYIARATVGESKASFFNVGIIDIISKEKGEPEKKLHEIFERAEINSPSIIFIDEIDALISRRDLETTEKRLLSQLLIEMDGFEKKKGIFVIGATNVPWSIDPAMRRAGRFTKQIFVSLPELSARIEIFKIHLRKKEVDKNIDLKKLAEATEGYASSDIKAICDSAARIPLEEAIHGGPERKISMTDLLTSIENQKSSLIPWYKMAKKQLSKSGEGEAYSELEKFIDDFEDVFSQENLKEELDREKVVLGLSGVSKKEQKKQLLDQKNNVEKLIATARQRYYSRKIDEESFRRIIKDYEKKLIEFNTKLADFNEKGEN